MRNSFSLSTIIGAPPPDIMFAAIWSTGYDDKPHEYAQAIQLSLKDYSQVRTARLTIIYRGLEREMT
jgi:hypothetical protein